MAKSLQAWKNQVYNKTIDLDNQSFDCVDVSKSWIQYLTGVNWQTSAGRGNAKDIYYNWSKTYLDRVRRGNAPKLGDIVCMDGTIGGGYGHTGVVVAINGPNITIYQQNTFTQKPVYTGVFNAYSSYIIGFMRPNSKASFTVGSTPKLQGFQRIASYAAKYRSAAKSTATLLQTFTAGDVYDFKGYVHGEKVDGNDVWFVGRYTGGYVWSGAFKDKQTHDLPNITPATKPKLKGYQREVGSSVINYRKDPEVMPDNVLKTFNPGEVLDFDAWTHGALVDATDIWFRGKHTGGWSHSGGFTDSTTHDLPEVKATVKPVPVDPVYPNPTTDPDVIKVYNKKHPLPENYSPTDLVSIGNQKLRKEAVASIKLMQTQTTSLVMGSGFRSFATQKSLYDNYVKEDGQEAADRYSARPGFSEHQTGLTMDFTPIDDQFKFTPAYIWLIGNAYKYGWILRYPADKETITGYMSEPWHWRYIGVAVATDMHNKGVTTLEEYYKVEGGAYIEPTDPSDPTAPVDPEKPTDPIKSLLEIIAKLLQKILDFLSNPFGKK